MDSRPSGNARVYLGEQYERFVPIFFGPWAAVLIDRLPPQPGERVLDLACGTGAVTRLVVERVGPSGTVVGADFSPSMLAAARRATAGLPIDWREADAAALPFADAAFDLVLCQQGLQFFPDRGAALREMRRVLAPNGRLGLAVWGPLEENAGFAALGRVYARHFGQQAADALHLSYMLGEPDLVRGLVAEAGFRAIGVRRETLPVRWPSAEALPRLQAAAGPIGATLTALSAEEWRALVDDFAAEVADYITEGELVYPSTSLLITARA